MKRIAPAFLIALIAAAAGAQSPRTFVSAKRGDDTNPCSLTSPCRSLHRGVDTVVAGGEVIPLDSGGYGSFTIPQSVTISAPPGVQASVTTVNAAEGPAVNIVPSGNPAINVTLRGLAISNVGGQGGIYSTSTGIVRVDSCSVDSASGHGIFQNAAGMLIVTESVITRSGSAGIAINGPPGVPTSFARAMIDHVLVSQSGWAGVVGLDANYVAVRNSVAIGNQNGILGYPGNSAYASYSRITVEGCSLVNNGNGVYASIPLLGAQNPVPDAVLVRVANSVIAHNSTGILGVRVFSRGDNTVADNASGEAFGSTFSSQ